MITVVLVVHLLIAMALVGVILIQRSEGGALGGLGGGTFGGLMTARGSANLLTRTTAILAACFIGTSLVLALLASHNRSRSSILDTPPPATSPAPAPSGPPVPTPGLPAPGAPTPTAPATPAPSRAAPGPSQPQGQSQPGQPAPASKPAEPGAPIAK